MRVLIVDGYNALHSSSEYRELLHADREAARDKLVQQLAEFAVAAGVDVTVVFDAHVPGGVTQRTVDGVTVRFGTNRRSADHVIERHVWELRDRGVGDVVVATNDRLVGDVVGPMGATVISIARLLEEMASNRVAPPLDRRPPADRKSARLEDQIGADLRERLEQMRRFPRDD